LVFGIGKKEKKELEKTETPVLSEIKPEIQKPPEEAGTLKIEKVPGGEIILPDINSQIERTSELETKVEKVKPKRVPKVLKTLTEPKTEGKTDMLVLEELSQKIENENIKTRRKIKSLSKKSQELTLDSPEIIDLIKLYERTSKKFREFIEDINNLEADGWEVDETVAAFYKFRIAKGLSSLKKEELNIENLCERVGFTPSKVHEILEKSTEALIQEFSEEAPAQEAELV